MAQKRGHNEGSIYKRKNGTWRAQVTLQGKRLSYNANTKKEAHEWIKKTLAQIDTGLSHQNAHVTVKSFMTDWLINIESTLRPNTIRQYRIVTELYIIPGLGNIKLKDLKPEHIQHRYNEMVRQGKGLRTIQVTHAVIHRALELAVKLGIISRNPDDATSPPRPKQKEMQFLDQSQVQQLLITARMKNDPYSHLYHLAVSTGMRQAELLGLMWPDLDWEKKTLQIQRQLTLKKGGGFELSTPKTKAGKRTIILGQASLESLRKHQQEQFNLMKKAEKKWQENDLIFTTSIGTSIDKYNLIKTFKKLLKDAGLPNIRFHDLRHTAATMMLNNGIPVIVVSKRLGHSKPSITLDVYGHLIPGKQQEAAELMDELLTPIQFDMAPQSKIAP